MVILVVLRKHISMAISYFHNKVGMLAISEGKLSQNKGNPAQEISTRTDYKLLMMAIISYTF